MRPQSAVLVVALGVSTACGVRFQSQDVAAQGGGGHAEPMGGNGGDPVTVGGGGQGGTSSAGGGGEAPLPCRGLAFDGDDDVVLVPDHPELDGLANITVEAWMLAPSYPGEVQLLSHHDHDAHTGYVLLIFGSGQMQFRYQFGGQNHPVGSSVVSPQEWHHVAATYDGQYVRLFIDGMRVAQQDIGNGVADDYAGPLAIGRASYVDGFPFEGTMDAVRLSRTARYVQDFEPGSFVVDDDTVGLWDFEGDGQVVLDATGQHDGTLGVDLGEGTDDPKRVPIPCSARR